MLDGFKTMHFDASCADAGAVILVMTETVNDNGFYRWNYYQPMHNNIQWYNEDNSNAEEVD